MSAKNRVLFVDDEEVVRTSWNRFLSEKGFDVTTANDGARAISELREHPVDVVVSDLRMPTVDGLELLAWLREEQPETRFIMLTGYGTQEVERRAKELGAFGYLNKPISPDTLAALVTAATHLKIMDFGAVEAPEQVAEPAVEIEPVVEEASQDGDDVERERSKLRESAGVVGGLIAAPIMGLAFVIFLPVIGFVGLTWYVGRALVDAVSAARG
jgi:DNA-binding NtrC family response regulator